MPSLIDVYAMFGEAAEAAQLLETQIGNLLIKAAIEKHGFRTKQNVPLAKKILGEIDRKTLGQLIKALSNSGPINEGLQELLGVALNERNRLNHAFYRQHNLRRNTESGRALMIEDLKGIHDRILDAYVAALALEGHEIEISEDAILKAESGHLPL